MYKFAIAALAGIALVVPGSDAPAVRGISVPRPPQEQSLETVANIKWAQAGEKGNCTVSNRRVIGKTVSMGDVVCSDIDGNEKSGTISLTAATGGSTLRVN